MSFFFGISVRITLISALREITGRLYKTVVFHLMKILFTGVQIAPLPSQYSPGIKRFKHAVLTMTDK
jgi:predicted ABC-type exoprotein transport system permease subunit